MIYLEKGQKVFEKPELVVYEQTGERNDADMVICAKIETPEEPFCWLEAQYIAYGNVVYSISDDKELEKEILKMDPDSTINDVANAPVENVAPAVQQPQVDPAPAPQQQQPAPTSGDPVSGSGAQTVEATPPIVEPTSTSTVPTVEPASTSTPPVVPAEVIIEQPAVPTGEPVLEIPTPAPVEVVEPVVVPPAPTPTPEPVVSFTKKRIKKSIG